MTSSNEVEQVILDGVVEALAKDIPADADFTTLDVRAWIFEHVAEDDVREMIKERLRRVLGPTVESIVEREVARGVVDAEAVVESVRRDMPKLGMADQTDVLVGVVRDVFTLLLERMGKEETPPGPLSPG